MGGGEGSIRRLGYSVEGRSFGMKREQALCRAQHLANQYNRTVVVYFSGYASDIVEYNAIPNTEPVVNR